MKDESTCKGRLRSVKLLVERGNTLSRKRKVDLVNRFVNRFTKYRSDNRQSTSIGDVEFQVRQEWSSLLQFLRLGGDCEDYATAKYQLLRLLDVPVDDLRVVVVYDRFEREHHAILGVMHEDDTVMLLDTDNSTYSKRPSKYRFVYGVNEQYVWDYGTKNTRLSRRVRQALSD